MGSLSPEEAREIVARQGVTVRTFVETGTHLATTLRPMYESGLFERLHSIELSDLLYERATAVFQGSGVSLHHGNSAEVLSRLVKELDEPALFWLDAHWYDDPHVAKGPTPLFAELQAIATRAQPDVVVIDDVQCFGKRWDACPEADWTDIHEDSILEVLGRGRTAAHYVVEHKFVVHRTAESPYPRR